MKVKDMTLTAVMAALICIAGPLTIAAGPVPLSLATFAVMLAGTVLGKKWGTAAAGLYLLIGIIGARSWPASVRSARRRKAGSGSCRP